jgi:hypothetical protein
MAHILLLLADASNVAAAVACPAPPPSRNTLGLLCTCWQTLNLASIFPSFNLLQVTEDLPEAFSLLGFAFYLQPLMMPIIREMPEGKTGRNALSAAVHASVLGE